MSDDLHRKVRDFIDRRFAGARSRSDEDSLLDSGVIDSIGILDLAGWLGESCGVELEDDDLTAANFDSVAAIVRFLASKSR